MKEKVKYFLAVVLLILEIAGPVNPTHAQTAWQGQIQKATILDVYASRNLTFESYALTGPGQTSLKNLSGFEPMQGQLEVSASPMTSYQNQATAVPPTQADVPVVDTPDTSPSWIDNSYKVALLAIIPVVVVGIFMALISGLGRRRRRN